jgi:hypothetical protein
MRSSHKVECVVCCVQICRHFQDTTSCVRHLQSRGFHVTAAHCPADEVANPRAPTSSDALPTSTRTASAPTATPLPSRELSTVEWATSPTAILLGNEIAGVSAEALAAVDSCTYIGTTGFVRSLNVSVAAAVIFHSAMVGTRASQPSPSAAVPEADPTCISAPMATAVGVTAPGRALASATEPMHELETSAGQPRIGDACSSANASSDDSFAELCARDLAKRGWSLAEMAEACSSC